MRLLYSLLFLLTIVTSDVIGSALYSTEHDMVLIDVNGESESENETEVELELKKEAKLHPEAGIHFNLLAKAIQNGLPNRTCANLLSTHPEVFSPPPELL